MPRHYKPVPGGKRYKKYNKNDVQQAVENYLMGNNSIKTVADKFNMHPSVLYRHSKGLVKSHGGQRALSLETEEYIIQYINICAEWGYPTDVLDLRYIVKMYLDKIGITHRRFKNNFPGPDFIQSFLNRHEDKISQMICQNVKSSRAGVLEETITKYFEELQKSLVDIPDTNIINYDETNLADDPRRRKILTKRGTKYPERVMNHPKGNVSIMIAGSAEGKILPPYVVYRAPNLYNTWISNGPKAARYNCSTSGWFDGTIFEDWIQSIVIPFFADKPGKKLLIGDNLSSHLSIDIIKLCKEKNINFVFLPSNSTHLTQPLDVAFFETIKSTWREILLQWKENDGRNETCVPKGCFPTLLNKLMEVIQENAESKLKEGFRKAGIFPLNPAQVLSQMPTQLTNTNRHREAVDDSVLNLLNDMRYATMGVRENKRKAGNSGSTTEDNVDLEIIPQKKIKKLENSTEKENLLTKITTKIKKTIKRKGIGKKIKKKLKMMKDKLYAEKKIMKGKVFVDKINDRVSDMPVYFASSNMEYGREITIQSSPLSDTSLIHPTVPTADVDTRLVNKSDHSSESAATEVINDDLPNIKQEKMIIIENIYSQAYW